MFHVDGVDELSGVAELDRRRHTDLIRGGAISKWLANAAQLPAGVARGRLSLAKRLAEDPALAVVAAALDTGRVGVDHARVLAAATNSDHLDIWAIHHHLLGPIPHRHIPAFLCDATFHAVVLDSLGLPLAAGGDLRHPTAAQRRALLARDGSCTFPGCDAHAGWLDAHHIRHWQHGGPTDIDNLAMLCRRHHRIAHRPSWTLELTHDGWTHWTAPDGHTFYGQRHHHQRAGP
jgi:hypothetical protein